MKEQVSDTCLFTRMILIHVTVYMVAKVPHCAQTLKDHYCEVHGYVHHICEPN